jgi:hypothetical protein
MAVIWKKKRKEQICHKEVQMRMLKNVNVDQVRGKECERITFAILQCAHLHIWFFLVARTKQIIDGRHMPIFH